jgi:hypothetical protein
MQADKFVVVETPVVGRKRRAKRGLKYSSRRVLLRSRMVKTQGRTKGVDLGETPRALTYPSETRLQELAECSSDSRELVDGENQKYSQLIEKELVNSPSTSLIESEMAVESNQSMERAKSVSI